MFIKFGDKTKTKIVKDSTDDSDKDEDAIYLDENESKDRRIPILKSYKKTTQKNNQTNKKT
jgi:hypothetical protein|tara:strand:- start:3530 stop:3712 length:183 start_codon:yes stop_codon:yes gene_type:complete